MTTNKLTPDFTAIESLHIQTCTNVIHPLKIKICLNQAKNKPTTAVQLMTTIRSANMQQFNLKGSRFKVLTMNGHQTYEMSVLAHIIFLIRLLQPTNLLIV